MEWQCWYVLRTYPARRYVVDLISRSRSQGALLGNKARIMESLVSQSRVEIGESFFHLEGVQLVCKLKNRFQGLRSNSDLQVGSERWCDHHSLPAKISQVKSDLSTTE